MADSRDKWLQEVLGISERTLALRKVLTQKGAAPDEASRKRQADLKKPFATGNQDAQTKLAGSIFIRESESGIAEERHGGVSEIDDMRASVVSAFRARVASMDNGEIVQEALKLDAKLGKGEAEVGPNEKSAIAETLIEMYSVLDSRIQAAPVDSDTGLPKIEGLKWDKGSPLEGLLVDISPFANADFWHTFVKGSAAGISKPPPRKRKPHIRVEVGPIKISKSSAQQEPSGDGKPDTDSSSPEVPEEEEAVQRKELIEGIHKLHTLTEAVELVEIAHIVELPTALAVSNGAVGLIALDTLIVLQLMNALEAGYQISHAQGVCYGIMYELVGLPDREIRQEAPLMLSEVQWKHHLEAWHQGLQEGRNRASDPDVHARLLLALAIRQKKAGAATAQLELLNELWQQQLPRLRQRESAPKQLSWPNP